MSSAAPLIAHIVHRLDYGGLENGLINLINRAPAQRYRHAIICLTGYSDFKNRVRRDDVEIFALDKKPGKDLGAYWRLWRLLRRLRPDIVHSRNFGTMDCAWVARVAGVPVRVHGEHGWDIVDLHGGNTRFRRLRKIFDRAITRYVVLSADLHRWMIDVNRVPAAKITRIVNGVDTERFHERAAARSKIPGSLQEPDRIVFGTVGRMHPVKNPLALARAYLRLLEQHRADGKKIGLVMVGDGPLRSEVQSLLAADGGAENVWLPGARDDVPDILRELDVFVLPSLNEGISNTVLEAMASGVAVVAPDVGGNSELIVDAETGRLLPDGSEQSLAVAMAAYVEQPALIRRHGAAARRRVVDEFKLDSMVAKYVGLYDSLIAATR